MAQYQYPPLDEEAKEIRLLTLLPAKFGSEVRVTIRNVQLHENNIPQYEALSYVWGSMENPVSIQVNPDFESSGSKPTLLVTQNLAAALPHLRYEAEPRVLWIDATCVDQRNLKERSRQVERMSDIYRLAERVLVWLGPESEDSSEALEWLNKRGSLVVVDWNLETMTYSSKVPDVAKEWYTAPQLILCDGLPTPAIIHLLSRSWFQRLWIRQEIQLANQENAVLYCGAKGIPWRLFSNAIFGLYHRLRPAYGFAARGRPPAVSLSELVLRAYRLCDNTGFALKLLLFQTRHCLCADARDKIYALLSVRTKQDKRLDIKPDYEKTTAEAYKGFVLAHIRDKRRVDILAMCEMKTAPPVRSDEEQSGLLPSWVPNWEAPKLAEPFYDMKAASDTSCDAQFLEDKVLKVKGVHAAVIDKVTCFNEHTIASYIDIEDWIKRLLEPMKADITAGFSYLGTESLLDACGRVMGFNRVADNYLPPNSNFASMQDARELIRQILDISERQTMDSSEKYEGAFHRFAKGRTFLTTNEGHIGFGPEALKPGDKICVLLGCASPIALRQVDLPSNDSPQYQVVGECYVQGLNEGEAFLGPSLPSHRRVMRYDEVSDQWGEAFVNCEDGSVSLHHPALGPLREGWRMEAGHSRVYGGCIYVNDATGERTEVHPNLSVEVLEERGIEFETFQLV